MQIDELPGIGAATAEAILAAVVREWAAAYLRGGGGAEVREEGARGGAGPQELGGAFAELEAMGAFETFRRRGSTTRLPGCQALAVRLQVSTQPINAREAAIERALASRMREEEEEWPIQIAVRQLQERIGAVSLAPRSSTRPLLRSTAARGHRRATCRTTARPCCWVPVARPIGIFGIAAQRLAPGREFAAERNYDLQ